MNELIKLRRDPVPSSCANDGQLATRELMSSMLSLEVIIYVTVDPLLPKLIILNPPKLSRYQVLP